MTSDKFLFRIMKTLIPTGANCRQPGAAGTASTACAAPIQRKLPSVDGAGAASTGARRRADKAWRARSPASLPPPSLVVIPVLVVRQQRREDARGPIRPSAMADADANVPGGKCCLSLGYKTA